MVSEKRTYEMIKGLLDGKQVSTLSSEQVLDCVQKRTLSELGTTAKLVYALHDGCEIRKPNSKELAYLGQVMSLSKQVINGYKTMNSVVVDTDNQEVRLLCHELYSNKMPNYIGQTTLSDADAVAKLSEEQQQMIVEKSYINTLVLFRKHLKSSSSLLKSANPSVAVAHVFDREFDDDSNFAYIDGELQDIFIARLKSNRNSHQNFHPLTLGGKVSTRTMSYKLIDKIYANSSVYDIAAIVIKGTKYEQVKAHIDWEVLKINEKDYTAVRITLLKDGKPLFLQPMLLLTNQVVNSAETAKSVYMAYLLRSKIEVVFRFLKQNLGWEAFQVRDFNSIKNLLAIAFFLVGFFPELEKELKTHPLSMQLCTLAKAKGKVTLHFLLKGLQMLTNFQQVAHWMQQNDLDSDDINQFLSEIGLSINLSRQT